MKYIFSFIAVCFIANIAIAQNNTKTTKGTGKPQVIESFPALGEEPQGPKVLVITAHPDDETGMAAVIYKITHDLKGIVDQCVITNGEAGYKYSTLGNEYYGLELTDPKIGRANLPRIRKQELTNAGKIIGMRNIYFLDQKDAHYGLDEREPLDTTWDVLKVSTKLHELLTATRYDYVFCLLPTPETHGGHKAATMLALQAVKGLKPTDRPAILGVTVSSKTDTTKTHFIQLKKYDETKVVGDTALYRFDVSTPFGYKNKLSYKVIVNWEIAEHKSQGTMQLAMNQGDYENFWLFDLNAQGADAKCKKLFEELKKVPYKTLEY
ncbi:MAG: family deacetylase [Bacteroidetes bacterium]|nr:family deacetylase [Bacteroidota bacterium]